MPGVKLHLLGFEETQAMQANANFTAGTVSPVQHRVEGTGTVPDFALIDVEGVGRYQRGQLGNVVMKLVPSKLP